jgi:predicted dehydrogenase
MQVCRGAAKAGVRVAVGETYVFTTAHQRARALIEEGEIGRPLQIRQRHGDWIERAKPSINTGPADRSWRVDAAKSGGGAYPWIFDHAVHFFAAAEYFALDEPIAEIYAVRAQRAGIEPQSGAAHDPYQKAEVDIPIITWKYQDEGVQGVWMRAERLNGKYDYMRGFSTTIVGEHGLIEVLGEEGTICCGRGNSNIWYCIARDKSPGVFASTKAVMMSGSLMYRITARGILIRCVI